MQAGDLMDTFADIEDLVSEFDYKPSVDMDVGADNFVKWFRGYYGI